MAKISIQDLDHVEALIGSEIAVSDWRTIEQPEVNQFADLSGDHQWTHIDTERAATSRFGQTIVHGLYTLLLGSRWSDEMIEFSGFDYALFYGYDKVRFPAPLPVGARVRVRLSIESVRPHGAGVLVGMRKLFEVDGEEKPVCVVDSLTWLSSDERAE